MDNNYTKKIITEMLNQTTYNISNIWGIIIGC
jgi:hypothetical protein